MHTTYAHLRGRRKIRRDIEPEPEVEPEKTQPPTLAKTKTINGGIIKKKEVESSINIPTFKKTKKREPQMSNIRLVL